MTATGELQVFSALEEESDNQNQGSTDPVWYQHADYSVYDAHGKLLAQIDNTTGHYENLRAEWPCRRVNTLSGLRQRITSRWRYQ